MRTSHQYEFPTIQITDVSCINVIGHQISDLMSDLEGNKNIPELKSS